MHLLYEICFGNVCGYIAFFWLPLVGAGLGLAKNFGDQAAANSQRKAQSEIERWSPYTGQHGQMVNDPSLFGNIATGAALGASAEGMFPNNNPAASSVGLPKPQEYNSSMFSQTPKSWLTMAQQMNRPASLYSN